MTPPSQSSAVKEPGRSLPKSRRHARLAATLVGVIGALVSLGPIEAATAAGGHATGGHRVGGSAAPPPLKAPGDNSPPGQQGQEPGPKEAPRPSRPPRPGSPLGSKNSRKNARSDQEQGAAEAVPSAALAAKAVNGSDTAVLIESTTAPGQQDGDQNQYVTRRPTASMREAAGTVPVANCHEANERIIEGLYVNHGRALVGYALTIIRDPHEAQDVLHDVFSRIVKENPHWMNSNGARTRLFTAVRNEAIDRLRRSYCLDLLDPAELDEIRHDEPGDSRDIGGLLRGWIHARLGARDRCVTIMRLDGMRLSDIACRLHLPLGTVKRRLHQAVKKLRFAQRNANVLGF